MQDEQLLTVPEIAENLRISEHTVRSLVKTGRIPYFKVGGRYRFYYSEVLKAMRKQGV